MAGLKALCVMQTVQISTWVLSDCQVCPCKVEEGRQLVLELSFGAL